MVASTPGRWSNGLFWMISRLHCACYTGDTGLWRRSRCRCSWTITNTIAWRSGTLFFDFVCKSFLLQYVHFLHFYIMLQDYNFALLTYCFQQVLGVLFLIVVQHHFQIRCVWLLPVRCPLLCLFLNSSLPHMQSSSPAVLWPWMTNINNTLAHIFLWFRS